MTVLAAHTRSKGKGSHPNKGSAQGSEGKAAGSRVVFIES